MSAQDQAESSVDQDQAVSGESASQAESAVENPAAEATTETESPSPQEASATDSAADATEAKPRRRVQLNPSADPNQFRAVPTVGVKAASSTHDTPRDVAAAEAMPAIEAGAANKIGQPAVETGDPPSKRQSSADVASSASAPTPVEIPAVSVDLDEALEAEIEAAMSGEEQSTPVESTASQIDAADDSQQLLEEELEEGAKLTGKVQSIHGENVFVELGYRSPGVMQLRQFESSKLPQVGQDIRVVANRYDADEGLIICSLPQGKHRVSGNWDEVAAGQVVDCMVTKTNKGGLEVTIGSLRGFMPAGQVDIRFVSDLEPYVGQKLRAKITEANRQKRNLIVSRRACLELEREEAAVELWKNLAVGQQFAGVVKTIKNYGAFVDIGSVDGFLHIGEISWSRIQHPSEVLAEGQQIDVQVLSVDLEKKRIGLGMRQLQQDPWSGISEKYQSSQTVSGVVTRTAEFGAFVELEKGVEGLIHISELDYRRVNRVTDVVKVGQEIDVQVTEVDPDRKRIGLSLKALQERPKDAKVEKVSDADLAPGGGAQYERKRKGPLKGGTGGSASGGLFGNPTDFK